MEEQNTQNPEIQKPIRKEGSVGALVGSIIVILIILAGGLYFMDSLRERVANQESDVATTTDASLEAELNTITTDDIETDLAEIEAEIEASLEE